MNEVKTSIIRIMPGASFEEAMEFVNANQAELRSRGICDTYEYELDPIFYPVHQMYNNSIEEAFAEALIEIQAMDIKPQYGTHKSMPSYYRLYLLLREFYHNCMSVYYKDQLRQSKFHQANEVRRIEVYPPLRLVQ